MTATYGRLNSAIAAKLKEIYGEQLVIYEDTGAMERYSHDETAEKQYAGMPEAVVFPQSTDQVSAIMQLASEHHIPVTPRGAGSGLSGGCVPVFGGIVMSFEKMNKIKEIDLENLMIVAEPGVVTNSINEALKKDGLFFAGYPMSLETCFLGGNVAENAGGGKAVKYGVTSRYITGLEVVLANGSVMRLGGKLRKDVTGYDLIHLMAGSEGTLGIVTEITLSLLPAPRYRAILLASFSSVESAISAVPRIMTGSRIVPTSIEYMDRASILASCSYLNETIPYGEAQAMLLIEVDGTAKEEVARSYMSIGDVCESCGANPVYVADNRTTMDRIWNVRRNIAEALKVQSPHQSLEDIVVPTAAIPGFMRELAELSRKEQVQIPCYGHAGDGNLHATIVKPGGWSLDTWLTRLDGILGELYQITRQFGGTISGEHGIGNKRKKFIGITLDPVALEMMKHIKRAFDPDGILNPGKIFP